MKKLSLVAWMTMKAAAAGVRPSRYSMLAYTGGKLRVNGIPLPVVVDLAGLQVSAGAPILIDHKNTVDHTFGQIEEIENDGRTLSLAGPITGVSPTVESVIAMASGASGSPQHRWQASITCHLLDWVEVSAGQQQNVNGQMHAGPFIWSKVSKLTETSILAAGADSETVVTLAASAASDEGMIAMSFEDWLKSLGLDVTALSPEAKDVLMKSFAAQQGGETPVVAAETEAPMKEEEKEPVVVAAGAGAPSIDLARQRKAYGNEARRIAGIEAVTGGFLEIRATAVEKNWTVEQTENAVLKKKLAGGAPAGHVRTPENSPLVIQAALCQASKLPNIEKHFDDKTLQAAHTEYRGRASLSELLLQAAVGNGYIRKGNRFSRLLPSEIDEVLTYAIPPRGSDLRLQAAASGGDLASALSNVANKFALQGYDTTKGMEVAMKISGSARSVSDYKEVTSFRLVDSGEYELIGANGKVSHGTLDTQSYTNRVKDRAKMYRITRVDIINDDLGLLDQVRELLGAGSARTFLKVFWTEFLADASTFYTTARGNYMEGASTPLDHTSLAAAEKLFLDQTTPQGTPLDIEAKYLLVPTGLGVTARELHQSTNLVGVSTGKNPQTNIFAGQFEPLIAPHLNNTAIGGSTTAWYLLPEPTPGLRVIERCYLNGQESPEVETAEAAFDENGGVQFKARFTFGVKKQEYRAAVKSKGAA